MSPDTLEAAEAEALAATERLEALRADRARAEAERAEVARAARVDLARRRLAVWQDARRVLRERRSEAGAALDVALESGDLQAISDASVDFAAAFLAVRVPLEHSVSDSEVLGLAVPTLTDARPLPGKALPFGDTPLGEALQRRALAAVPALVAAAYESVGLTPGAASVD